MQVAAVMEFFLLGPLEVRHGGRVVPVAPGRQRALLAALLLSGNRVVMADELAEALWGSVPPPSARASLQTYVMRLRQALGDAGRSRITSQPGGYLISLRPGELDVERFESSLAAARQAARAGSHAAAAGRLRAALSLWRGQPLAGVPSDILAVREVPRLAEMRLQALEARIEADLHLGRHAEVIVELRQLAAAEPLRERLHALLMLALYRDGQQARALAAYQAVRRVLVAELGAEPGAELRRLQQQILTADPALAAPAHAADSSLEVLGLGGAGCEELSSRLVVDLGGEGTPASVLAGRQGSSGRGGGARRERVVPQQLPAAVRHFAGRADELAALDGLLDGAGGGPGTVVISAIDGTAGVGKTTLAVRWAHSVAERFPDGQLYVNLRGFDPSGVPVAAAEAVRGFLDALQVPVRQIPASLDAQAGLYRSLLAGKRMLIVLDNARDAEHVRPLLPGSRACCVIVTSRCSLMSLVASQGRAPAHARCSDRGGST